MFRKLFQNMRKPKVLSNGALEPSPQQQEGSICWKYEPDPAVPDGPAQEFKDFAGNTIYQFDTVLLPSGQTGTVWLPSFSTVPCVFVFGYMCLSGVNFNRLHYLSKGYDASKPKTGYTFCSQDPSVVRISDLENAFGSDGNGGLKGILVIRRDNENIANDNQKEQFGQAYWGKL